jgi:hypothetical protein
MGRNRRIKGGMRYLWVLLILLALVTGCASIPMKALNSEGLKVIYRQDIPILVSSKIHMITLGVPASYPWNGRPYIYIGLLNGSTKEFTFSTDNICVSEGNEVLKVYTHEELREEYERRIQAAIVLMAFAGAMQSASAYQPSTTYIYGPRGYVGYAQTYNPAAAIQAQQLAMSNTMQLMSAIKNSDDPNLVIINNALRKNTILPGYFAEGIITFDLPYDPGKPGKRTVSILVKLPEENHEFTVEIGE